MTLLFIDGADHYATADINKKWNSSDSVTVASSNGRRSGGALALNSFPYTPYVEKVLPSAITSVIVGFAYNANNNGTGQDLIQFKDGSLTHAGLLIDATNMRIGCWRATGPVFAYSANNSVPTSGFIYIECKVTISDTVGTFDVKINGASVISLTNLDTRNGGNATMDRVRFMTGLSGGNLVYLDDIYICDTAGSTNNSFLGDVRVDTIFPNVDGNYSQFTPSTGTTHYTLVDESTPNTTDYNDGAAVGDRDSYGMQNLSALSSQTVYGVQVNAAILKDDSGSRSAGTFVRSGTTNSDGASVVLGTSQTYITQVFETNPDTSSAWTESTVNSMEAGVKVTA